MLTPLERIDRIAALVPRPRTPRHCHYGVLAPNALLCAAVTALAPAAAPPAPASAANDEEPSHRAVARYLLAMLLARLYEAFPVHNQNPKPFVWTAKANDILQKVTRADSKLSSKKNEALH